MDNPFPTSGYFGEEYFCDRAEETENLIRYISGGQSITLISLRRMGKTGLVYHLKEKLDKKYIFVYADILSTENKTEMLEVLTSALLKVVNNETSVGKKIWEFIKMLRPVVSYDTLTGTPQVSFDIKEAVAENNINNLLDFLDKLSSPVVIAFDEFQQITEYPEKNADAWLRTKYQHLKNIHFIFSGSKKHIMLNLFGNPSKPFYMSTAMMHLDRIPKQEYVVFIQKHFQDNKRKIDEQTIVEILDWCDVHTYYVQLLCNRVFSSGEKKIGTETWQKEAYKILKEQEAMFFNIRDLLTKPQWNLLMAIGLENKTYAPTSKDFIAKYKLGSPATVFRSLEALLEKEMIYSDFDEKGSYYMVYDLLMRRWVQQIKVKP